MVRGAEPSGEKRLSEEASRLLKQVSGELAAKRDKEAVRLFGELLSQNVVSAGSDLSQFVARYMGKEAAGRLVTAYVRHPCFYCRNGLEQCETCDGRGYSSEGNSCDRCLATGTARCDFCDGAGLLQYSAIPAGLHSAVLLSRTNLAVRHLKKHFAQPLPRASSGKPAAVLKHSANEVLRINQYLGILENALVLARNLAEGQAATKDLAEQVVSRCARYAVRSRERVNQLLEVMAASAERASRLPDASQSAHERSQKQATFYRTLLEPEFTFAGTSLEHPFLWETAKELKPDAGQARRKPASTRKRGRSSRSTTPAGDDESESPP